MHDSTPSHRRLRRALRAGASALALLACLLPHPGWAAGPAPQGLEPSQLETLALEALEARQGSLGLTARDLTDAKVADRVVSRHTGALHLYLQQTYDGIEVHNAILNITVTRDGVVAHVGNRFVPDLASVVVPGGARISPQQAVAFTAQALELGSPRDLAVLETSSGRNRRTLLSEAGISHQRIPARLVYLPLQGGRVKLAWDVEIDALDSLHWWSVRVDAETGALLDTDDFVDQEQYLTYPQPIESPQHTTPLPPADGRTVAVDPYLDSAASPFGWHDTDGSAGPEFTITRGNNVHAYADRNADNAPDGGADAEPDGGAGLDFTGGVVPMDLSMAPNTYVQAAIANLFYWNNILHDVLWEYGFDEASGNFQVNNYGNGGQGADDVRAEAQDGSGNCNANFAT
ncbi:MAG: M36 family metallopeptidase, partial [Acidobacteria bacterium]|nr:M36 family metallopeptidase [Acidobacteriota bacterium]